MAIAMAISQFLDASVSAPAAVGSSIALHTTTTGAKDSSAAALQQMAVVAAVVQAAAILPQSLQEFPSSALSTSHSSPAFPSRRTGNLSLLV
jgi:hypothetical protein